ncbi:MAG: serine protein kinase RIO [Candidatus Altiarchaeota archaeon]
MKEDEVYDKLSKTEVDGRISGRHSRRKISERVFDNATLLTLSKLSRKGAFTEIKSLVSQGKEANVYHGLRDGESVALKIYAYETSDFKNMGKYIRGDPRFTSWKNKRQLVNTWAQKEYSNLSRISGEVECPKPIAVMNNVLVMQFIGDDGIPAPRLKDSALKDPTGYFNRTLDYMRKMYSRGLVHGDLSEYNLLDWGRPVVIDFSTGVLLEHPLAEEFVERDVANIVNYFTKQGVKAEYNEVLRKVRSGD